VILLPADLSHGISFSHAWVISCLSITKLPQLPLSPMALSANKTKSATKPNRLAQLFRRKTKDSPASKAATPDPIAAPPTMTTQVSGLDLAVADLKSACEELEQIVISCRDSLDPQLWAQAVLISPSNLASAEGLCQWLTLAASKKDSTKSTGRAQTMRKQILGGMNQGIKTTAHFLSTAFKTALGIGTQLSAVASFHYVTQSLQFPVLAPLGPACSAASLVVEVFNFQ